MPVERIQQEITPLIRLAEFKGLRSDRPLSQFEPGDLSVADNVDIDNAGSLTLRPGYTPVSGVPTHSLWSDDVVCLAVMGGSLCRLDTSYAATPKYTLQDPFSPISYAKVNDRVYFSNGVDSGIFADGRVRSWGITPPTPPEAARTVGDMPKGEYQVLCTFSRSDGQESGSSAAIYLSVPAGSGLDISLPSSTDTDVVAVNIYVSTPGGETTYLAATVPNGTPRFTYTASTLELNLPLATAYLSPPPPGQLITYFKGHMYVAVGEVIYPSEPYAYELFDLRKGMPLEARVTMMAPIEHKSTNGMFVGTTISCGVLPGRSPAEFEYIRKTDYGAIEGAVTYVDGSLYGDNKTGAEPIPMWLTSEGVCVGMPGMEVSNLTRTRCTIQASGRGSALFVAEANKFIATSNF